MAEDVWTVKRILAWIEGYLADRAVENPRLSAQWLVADALGVDRMQLFLDPERPLDEEERGALRDYTRRRGAGEPLQYITGKTDFRYITVRVRKGVLIPRPETEVLVSEALLLLPSAPKPQEAFDGELVAHLRALQGEPDELEVAEAPEEEPVQLLIADVCTGSGCIACSIAKEHPLARVIATDISPEACALANENVQELGLGDRVEVIKCDLGEGIATELVGTFDLVVSNPPYIPQDVLVELPGEVHDYEPALALDGGADGLAVYRRLLDWAHEALRPGGAFACELHETCLDDAAAEAEYAGYVDVRIVDDLAGRPRVLTCRKRS